MRCRATDPLTFLSDMYLPVSFRLHFSRKLPLLPYSYVSPGYWVDGFRTKTVRLYGCFTELSVRICRFT